MFVDLSILNANLNDIENYLTKLSDIKYVHLDIMDGIFVKETSFDENVVRKCHNTLKDSIMDVHLMVENPDLMFSKYKDAGASYITFHYEIGDIKRRIDEIHKLGLKAGLSLNPGTDIKELIPYLKDLDLVLVMSVWPGRGGQKYIVESTDKLKFLYDYRRDNNLNYLINVDGGINFETYKNVIDYADLAVVGSAITKSEDYVSTYKKYKKLFKSEVDEL